MVKNNSKKTGKILSFLLAITFILSASVTVFGATISSIDVGSASNGSVIINFDSTVNDVDTSKFRLSAKVGSEAERLLTVRTAEAVSSSRTKYKLTFDRVTSGSTDERVNCYLSYDGGSEITTFDFMTSSTDSTSFEVISSDNGSIVIEFTDSKSDVSYTDFKTKMYVDDVNKGSLSFKKIDKLDGYNGKRFKLFYDSVETKSFSQNVEIEIEYLNSSKKTSEFTLYPSGSVSDKDYLADYKDRKDAQFEIRSIKNGEIAIRFDNSTNAVVTTRDFDAIYYINGTKKGDLKITDVIEDSGRVGIDYTLFFDKIDSTDIDQTITVLLFYNRETRKPVIDSFNIKIDELADELVLSVKDVLEFKEKVTIPEIKIEERGKNLIFPSPNHNKDIEQIKLEAPKGFEWNAKKGSVSGTGGLKGAREYDITIGNDKNTLLIGLYNIDKVRTEKGTLTIQNLELVATKEAETGDVKVNIGGAGIPFERITVAKLTESVPVKTTHKVVIRANQNYLTVNDKPVMMDTEAYIDSSDRVMVPVSHVAFAFGFNPNKGIGWDWDDATKTATLRADDKTIQFTINSTIMYVNNVPTTMETSAQIKDGRTFIPIRYLGDAIGFTFVWDDSIKTAYAESIVIKEQ